MLSEVRGERTGTHVLVKLGTNPPHRQLDRIKHEQNHATSFEVVAWEWLVPARLRRGHQKLTTRHAATHGLSRKSGRLPAKQLIPTHAPERAEDGAEEEQPVVVVEAKRTMPTVFKLAVSTPRRQRSGVVRQVLLANKTAPAKGHAGRHWRARMRSHTATDRTKPITEATLWQVLNQLGWGRKVQPACDTSTILSRPPC